MTEVAVPNDDVPNKVDEEEALPSELPKGFRQAKIAPLESTDELNGGNSERLSAGASKSSPPSRGKNGLSPSMAAQTPMSESYLHTCRDLFALFDTDKSGAIDADEVYDALTAQGVVISPKNARALVAEVDADGSGEIEFDEFLKLLEIIGPPPESFDGAATFATGTCDISKVIGEKGSQMMKIDTNEMQELEARMSATCPKNHPCLKTQLAELQSLPYFFGGGGFVCARCSIPSENLAARFGFLCVECEYMICTQCAATLKDAQVEQEVQKRVEQRKKELHRGGCQSPKANKLQREGKFFQRVLERPLFEVQESSDSELD